MQGFVGWAIYVKERPVRKNFVQCNETSGTSVLVWDVSIKPTVHVTFGDKTLGEKKQVTTNRNNK